MSTPAVNPYGGEDLGDVLAATRAELHDLATMGAIITSIHNIDAVLSVVMDMAVRLVDGEVGVILLEDHGELTTRIAWGVDADMVRSLRYRDDLDLAAWCHENGESVILNDMKIVEREGPRIDSAICAPIKTSHHAHGVMLIINKASGGKFGDDDRERMEMLLNFVAVAIDNARLLEEQLQRQKIEQEMAIARQVQETILPQDVHSLPGVETGVAYYPAREVGGDFYDLHRLSETSFLAMIGDVSNKGVPAALVMSAAAGIIKSILDAEPEIPVNALAGRLNRLLQNEIIKHREMFITLFFARFDMAAREVTYCNAGHLPGLFWSARDRAVIELPEGGPIVGQFPDITFELGRRSIDSGDRLFLFTDGLTEAEDARRQLFGRERVEQVFAAEIDLDPNDFCVTVKQWIDRFAEGAPPDSRDDFTILQVQVK